MRAGPKRPHYDSLVAALIELRAELYLLERRKTVRQERYRRLGRETDDLIDNALEEADDHETAAAAPRYDGRRMRYTAPPSRPGAQIRAASGQSRQ